MLTVVILWMKISMIQPRRRRVVMDYASLSLGAPVRTKAGYL